MTAVEFDSQCPHCNEPCNADDLVKYRGQLMCEECQEGCIDGERDDWHEMREEGYLIDGVGFADPGGGSALRAETATNPRNLPCPSCQRPNMLTQIDRSRGYQCDICADEAERGW